MARSSSRYPVSTVLILSTVLFSKTIVQSSSINPVYAFAPSSPILLKHNATVAALAKIASSTGPPPSMESMSKESVRTPSKAPFNILSPLKLPGHKKTIPESALANYHNPQHLTSAVPAHGNVPIPAPTLLPSSPVVSPSKVYKTPQVHKPTKVHGAFPQSPTFNSNGKHPLVPVHNPFTNATNNDARSLFPMRKSGIKAVNDFVNYVPLDYENGKITDTFIPHKRELPRMNRRAGRGPPSSRRAATNSSSTFKNIISSFHDKVSRILMGPRRRSSRPMGPNNKINRRQNLHKLRFDPTVMEDPSRSFTERVDVKQPRAGESATPASFSAALNTVAKFLQQQKYVPVLGKRERVRALSKDESEKLNISNRRYRKIRRRPPPRARHYPRKRRPYGGPPRSRYPKYRGNQYEEEEDQERERDIQHLQFFKTHKEHHHHLGMLEDPKEEILISHRPLGRPLKYLGFKDQPHFNDDFHIPAYKESGPPYKAFSSFRNSFKSFKPWKPNFAEFQELREEHEGVRVPATQIKDLDIYRRKPSWVTDGEDDLPSHYRKPIYHKKPHHHDKYKDYSSEAYYDPPGASDDVFKPIKSPYHKDKSRDYEDSPRKSKKYHKILDYDNGLVGVNHFTHLDTRMKLGASIPAIVKEDSDAKVPKIIINHHHNLPPAAAGSSFIPGAAFANPLMNFNPNMHYQDFYTGANLPGVSNVGMKRNFKSGEFVLNDFGKPPLPFGAPPRGFGMVASSPGTPFGGRPPLAGGPFGAPGSSLPPAAGGPMNSPMAFQNFGHNIASHWMMGKQASPHLDQGHFGPPSGLDGPPSGMDGPHEDPEHFGPPSAMSGPPPDVSHAPPMPDHFPKSFHAAFPSGPPEDHPPGGFDGPHNEMNHPFPHGQNHPGHPDHSPPFGHDAPPSHLPPFNRDTSSPFNGDNLHGPSSSPFSGENSILPPASFMNHQHSSEGPPFGGQGPMSSEHHLPPPDASPFPSTNDPQDSLGFIPPFTPVPTKAPRPTQAPNSAGSRESFFRFNNPVSREQNRPPNSVGLDLTVVKTLSAGFELPPNPLSPMGNEKQQQQSKPNIFELGVPDREHYKNKRQRQRHNNNPFRRTPPQGGREQHREPQSKSSSVPSARNKVQPVENNPNYSTLPENWTEFRPDPSHNKLPSLTYDSLEIGSRMYKIKSALTPKGIVKAIMNRFPRARFFEKGKANRAHTKFTPYDAIAKSDEELGLTNPARKRRKSTKSPNSIQDIINSDSTNNQREFVVALPEEDAAKFGSDTNIILNNDGVLSEAAASGDNNSYGDHIQPSSSTPKETVVQLVAADDVPHLRPRGRRVLRQKFRSVNRSNDTPKEGEVISLVSNGEFHTGGGEQDDLYDDMITGMQSINVPVKTEIRMGSVTDVKKKKK